MLPVSTYPLLGPDGTHERGHHLALVGNRLVVRIDDKPVLRASVDLRSFCEYAEVAQASASTGILLGELLPTPLRRELGERGLRLARAFLKPLAAELAGRVLLEQPPVLHRDGSVTVAIMPYLDELDYRSLYFPTLARFNQEDELPYRMTISPDAFRPVERFSLGPWVEQAQARDYDDTCLSFCYAGDSLIINRLPVQLPGVAVLCMLDTNSSRSYPPFLVSRPILDEMLNLLCDTARHRHVS